MCGADSRAMAPSGAAPLRVFLVEDSTLIRERLEEGLGATGDIAIVGHADCAQDAIDALNALQCDAVILDLQLRRGNGFAVLRMLRGAAHGPQPVIIVFTNFASPHYRDMSIRGGADYFFDKSRDYDRVREVLSGLAPTPPHAGAGR